MQSFPIKRILLAGVVGTLLFDVFGLMASAMMGNPTWWDIPALLAGKLGLPLFFGVLAHYLNGIVLAVIYAAVAPFLWGSKWARAFTYITAETVLGVWLFMAPLLGMGIAGVNGPMGAMFAIVSLVRHWVYAIALAVFIPVPAAAPSTNATASATA